MSEGLARRITFGAAKYRNKPTEVDGFLFDSKKEARRYQQLQLLEKAGRVRDLQKQVKFELPINGQLVARYTADFTYMEFNRGAWESVVEDVKGMKTPVYRLKKKLMKAIHGVVIRET